MDGTTAKACVIQRGVPSLSPDYFVGGYNQGLAIRIPVLDIVEVGTGGGSIAWLDSAPSRDQWYLDQPALVAPSGAAIVKDRWYRD